MIPIIFFTFFVLYLAWFIHFSRRLTGYLQTILDGKSQTLQHNLENLILGKNAIHQARVKLEKEAERIFTLYDVAKEMTKTLKEEEAFERFKHKLSEHISFLSCRLLGPLSGELKELMQAKDYFIFPLMSKNKKLGFLAIQGMKYEMKETASILGQQFALALSRVKLYEEIEQVAITDGLTGVNTRRHTLLRLQEELRRASVRDTKTSILMIDADFFKSLNDTYGHLAGDQVLREIAVILRENVRSIDIVGRYGGEEFFVILPDTHSDGARFVGERIRQAVEAVPIKAYDENVKATVSIGVATFPQDGRQLEELIDKADTALYRAKKLGRNRVCTSSR